MGRDRFLHAVDGVSLTIQSNEILGLVGESGSGKSTFGKTLIGLHERTAGEAFLNDVPYPPNSPRQTTSPSRGRCR